MFSDIFLLDYCQFSGDEWNCLVVLKVLKNDIKKLKSNVSFQKQCPVTVGKSTKHVFMGTMYALERRFNNSCSQ